MKISVTVFLLFASSLIFCQTKLDSISGKQVATEVESMPVFPGGTNELMKYISKNLVLPVLKEYPPNASVYVRFIINSDGKVSDVKIINGTGNYEVDNAVKNLILNMPDWVPGTQKGKPVNCFYNLPISCIKYK